MYRQLADGIRLGIEAGRLRLGDRLPATRELAGRLRLNRTTVAAAYAVLEEAGLLQGQVGRGSFVAGPAVTCSELDLPAVDLPAGRTGSPIDFASSRPGTEAFPLREFRRVTRDVIDSATAGDILQLGSPYGYGPLRRYLLNQGESNGWLTPGDDLLITNGCQQALDLLARVLVQRHAPVLVEDPVYHGLLRVFESAGAHLIPVPVGQRGLDVDSLERLIEQHRPCLLAVTPDFQNPTGSTLDLAGRQRIVDLSAETGLPVVESGVYRKLRYRGKQLPSLKQLDRAGNVIAVASYSKIAFPGLRVGWVVAPRPILAKVAEAKQTCDLHSDQLSQAVLLRFAESGELARHLEHSVASGAERLTAALDGCEAHLPLGVRFTRPEGGMNLWVQLPVPLRAADLLRAVEQRGVTFLPGEHFSYRREHRHGFRLSFGGLQPKEIEAGLSILGSAIGEMIAAQQGRYSLEPDAALV